jgi:hypothetical protein
MSAILRWTSSPAQVFLLTHSVRFARPPAEFLIEIGRPSDAKMMDVVPWRNGIDPRETRVFQSACQDQMADQIRTPHGHGGKGHAHLKSNPRLLRHHRDRPKSPK